MARQRPGLCQPRLFCDSVGVCAHLNVCTRSPPASPRTCSSKVSVPDDCLGQVRTVHVEMAWPASLPRVWAITRQRLYLLDRCTHPAQTGRASSRLAEGLRHTSIIPDLSSTVFLYLTVNSVAV